MNRPNIEHLKQKILDRDQICVYCGDYATEVDHVVPWNYVHCNDEDNFVGACRDCNGIASDKVFVDFNAKREYILSMRKHRKFKAKLLARISVCVGCGKLFPPRKKGSTIFYCKDCNYFISSVSLPPGSAYKGITKATLLEWPADTTAQETCLGASPPQLVILGAVPILYHKGIKKTGIPAGRNPLVVQSS
jgi:hypothetical protein